MNQDSLAASMCTSSHQEILQYQNQYSYQQQQQQRHQRMMMYGAPTPIASPEHIHRRISLDQFQQHQNQQQQYEKLRCASMQHYYQLDGDRSQDESRDRDVTHSQRYTSANWNNGNSPTLTNALVSDNSSHPSAKTSNQKSPYISPQNQMLNHTNIKHDSSTGVSPSPQLGMLGAVPTNTNSVVSQERPWSRYPSQEPYPVGQGHISALFQQQQQRPRLTTTLWEDEGTICFQVDARGICVARRQDNNMVNGTKLLNVAGMSRGKRDGILKNEKGRVVVKVGAMHLKGVWVTIERAKLLSAQFKILDLLYPLFVDEPNVFLFSPAQHSISSLPSPSINQLLQGGPSITDQRQSSPLQTSAIARYNLDPTCSTRQPQIYAGPVTAFSANRNLVRGAKSNGRHTSEVDMYLSQGQFPATGIDFRGMANPTSYQHANGGYTGSFNIASHFRNHSLNGYGPMSSPTTMSRSLTSGGVTATGPIYIGESNIPGTSNMHQHEQQLNHHQFQNQLQLQQHRRILHATSAELTQIQASSTSKNLARSVSTSPKPVPSNANVRSLTFRSPSGTQYRPNVYETFSNFSESSGGSEAPPSQTFKTSKRAHDNDAGASTHISFLPGNNFPSLLSVSPPPTPIQCPDLSPLESCSPPSTKRVKADHSAQGLLHLKSAEQQLSRPQLNAEGNAEKEQHGQNPTTFRNDNGKEHCSPWNNGQKDNVPSSNAQGDNQLVQSIPPHLELSRSPQAKKDCNDLQNSSYDFDGNEPLAVSASSMQTNQFKFPSASQYRQQQEYASADLDRKTGALSPINANSEGPFPVLRSSSCQLLDSQLAVDALLGSTDEIDADTACATDQRKLLPSPTTEIQW